MSPALRAAAVAASALLLSPALAACTTTVTVQAAPHATDPACAEMLVSLRGADELAGRPRHEVSAQSAAAWGDPPIVLRCGVEPPGPSTETCIEANGVDWVGSVDPATGDARYVTFGRVPAVEIRVPDAGTGELSDALAQLAPAMAALKQTQRKCL
ncbi:MAG TPA: DUF3515 family protein [Actinomycetales bacterium]|nr:DUF3515 family protein [Actinomycetales bacterium]